jgi:hypothetical protein
MSFLSLLQRNTLGDAIEAVYQVTLLLTRADSAGYARGKGLAATLEHKLSTERRSLVREIVNAIEVSEGKSIEQLDTTIKNRYVVLLSSETSQITSKDDASLREKAHQVLLEMRAETPPR